MLRFVKLKVRSSVSSPKRKLSPMRQCVYVPFVSDKLSPFRPEAVRSCRPRADARRQVHGNILNRGWVAAQCKRSAHSFDCFPRKPAFFINALCGCRRDHSNCFKIRLITNPCVRPVICQWLNTEIRSVPSARQVSPESTEKAI